MTNDYLLNLIKQVAEEQGYEIDGGEKRFFIYIDKWNSVAYKINENRAGYLQVHQWEEGTEKDENGVYGRAVYSLRNVTDVVQFCNILLASSALRAKRRD